MQLHSLQSPGRVPALQSKGMDPMSATTQAELSVLLEQTGARPRGNRHDCPKCGGFRTITHTDECFFCHRCQWKGNAVTLAKELGIHRRISSAEYLEQSRKRQRANDAALRLFAAAHRRQLELRERLRQLGRAELFAHDSGLEDASTWEVLSRVYAERPLIEQELDALESADPAIVLESLNAARQFAVQITFQDSL